MYLPNEISNGEGHLKCRAGEGDGWETSKLVEKAGVDLKLKDSKKRGG